MTIEQAQDVFIILVFGVVAAIGISKLCDLIKSLFTVPVEELPEAEPIAKSPAPAPTGNGANTNIQHDCNTKEDTVQ